VASKTKKGYTPDESGVAFRGTEHAGEVTGFRAQLLNEISAEQAAELGDDWLVQQKFDGERRWLSVEDGHSVFANRDGLATGVQEPVAAAWEALTNTSLSFSADGEDMGDYVVIFDVTRHPGLVSGTFQERAELLLEIQETIKGLGLEDHLKVEIPVPAQDFFKGRDKTLLEAGAEGYVLRHKNSVYTPGKPSSGGEALKVKFWDDVSCRVAQGRDGKSSVGLELLDENGTWISVGNVTVPQGKKPEIGAIIDVKYLYAYKNGSIYQPTFKGVRTDIPESDCRMDRLKYKVEAAPRAETDDPGIMP